MFALHVRSAARDRAREREHVMRDPAAARERPDAHHDVLSGGLVQTLLGDHLERELREHCCRLVPKSFVISISLSTCASRPWWIAVSMRATAHSCVAT